MIKPTKDDVEALVSKLRSWDDAYYNKTPLVSDAVYDTERDRVVAILQEHYPDHPYLDEVGAPTPDGSVWPKFNHTTVMGSLAKVNNQDDFNRWAKGKGKGFHLAEKADGCTIVAYYQDGNLATLATRGDGVEGEDITPNAKYFENVKLKLPTRFTGILRGEGIITLDKFQKYFAPLGMANPRNAASGKARDTKNPDLKRHISVLWFDVITDKEDFVTWEDKFSFMEDTLGLKTIPNYPVTANEVWDTYNEYATKLRAQLNYWIDGLVVRVSNISEHEALGVVSNRPKGSIALKFPTNGVKTVLVDVEFGRGLSGRITPVGIIEPVLIDGTTVTRLSLHGADWIEEMGLGLGDIVEVAKAGDIIPQITAKLADGIDREPIQFPTTCPDCDVALVRIGAYVECHNPECHGETYGSMMKWINVVGINGVGPSIMQELIKRVKDPADLYAADVKVFIQAAGSDKIGKKIFKEVQAAKNLPLAQVLSGLHIGSLGTTNGQRIANHFKSLVKVMTATEDDLRKIPGIAENARKIVHGLHAKRDLIKRLNTLINIQSVATGVFSGQSFCITGTLGSGRKREEVESWIKSIGGEVRSSVSRDLTYLVTDTPDSGSSKNAKADKYGVKKITEKQLYALAPDNPIDGRKVGTASKRAKLSVKRGGGLSLFGDAEPGEAWIEVAGGDGEFEIVNSDLLENKAKLGFISWDGSVTDLDDGESPQSAKLRISSHLKWKDVELTPKVIKASSLDELKEALSHVMLCSWFEEDL